MNSFGEILAAIYRRADPDLRAAIDEGRKRAALELAAAREALRPRPDDDAIRAEGLRNLRQILAETPSPILKWKRKDLDPVEAWLDGLGWFEINAETAPTSFKFMAVMDRRRLLGKSVRRRFKELGIR